MSDERLRKLERAWKDSGTARDHAKLLAERLRVGELTHAHLALAAYLGSEGALAIVGRDPSREPADLRDWAWGLCEWGKEVLVRAAVLLARPARSACEEGRFEVWLRPLFRAEAFTRTLQAAEEWVQSPSDEAVQCAALAAEGAEADLERVESALEEASADLEQLDRRERGLLAAEASVNAARAAAWAPEHDLLDPPPERSLEAEAREAEGPALNALEAILQAARSLGLDEGELKARLRADLVPWALGSPAPSLAHNSARALANLAYYDRRSAFSPGSVLAMEGRPWSYIPLHPFADGSDAQRQGSPPEACTSVDAYWQLGEDVVLLQVVAHKTRRSNHAYGFKARWNEWTPPLLEVSAAVRGPVLTRSLFEACMVAWSALRKVERRFTRSPRRIEGELWVYLDGERPPPEGWTLVRWPEEAIGLLKTGLVSQLSLDHDLGDEGDHRTGYTVLKWLEEAVATQGFPPPALLRVHSANTSAKQKMELAIGSIRRLAERERG